MTTVKKGQIEDNITYSSLFRQSVINGNFDVWQRGVTGTDPATSTFIADRWLSIFNVDGGTNPTIVQSRQALTPGDIPNSFYFYRFNTNGAGSSYGANAYYQVRQHIEYGTRYLCGLNKKITVSFYARSDIASRVLGVGIQQRYGTGGSPTSAEIITGATVNLTSSWVKYTATFTTNTLVGKTFGTANDDFLLVGFGFIESAAVGMRGSGNIDIAQVQLCAGDTALPFQPKSFEEELRACQRYYEQSYDMGVAAGTSTAVGADIFYSRGTDERHTTFFKVQKRTNVAGTAYSTTGASGKIRNLTDGNDVAWGDASSPGTYSVTWYPSAGVTTTKIYAFQWTVSAEL